jgi:hypothetical protein
MYNQFPTNFTNFPNILGKKIAKFSYKKWKKKKSTLGVLGTYLMFAEKRVSFSFFSPKILLLAFKESRKL